MRNTKVLYGGLAIAVVLVAIVLVVVVPRLTRDASPRQKQQGFSAEAKDFVAKYGDRYSDPVSTYYAEKAYETKNNSPGLLMSDNFISDFEITNNIDVTASDLEFTMMRLPLDTKVCQETSIKVFNNYTSENLSQYMNLLAKNPGQKAEDIIDSQFLNYCAGNYLGKYDSNMWNTKADTAAKKLMDTVKNIVTEYGGAANYSTCPSPSVRCPE
jgi:hypothetical protein